MKMPKKIAIVSAALAILIILSISAYAQASPQNPALQCNDTKRPDGKTCFIYFHGNGCSHCAKVDPLIAELSKNAGIMIKDYEIYENEENRVLMQDYFNVFNVPGDDMGIPAVFIDNKYIVGDGPILENLKKMLEEHKGAECPDIDEKKAVGITGAKSPAQKLKALSLVTVIGAAIVDSINPCAIAVLLILLGTLIVSGDRKKALKAGLAFIVSIYIVYFLFGVGLFSALKVTGLSYWFYKIIGIIAVLIGLANLKDYFWYGAGGFVTEIPMAWRPIIKKLLGSVTSPLGAFLMGFVVCLFELPCTGGPYIVILGLLAERITLFASIPLLLIYNLFFVLPLIFITFMIIFCCTWIKCKIKFFI